MNTITLKAYAKINLALDVIGRRKNGYHDVRMIMQTIKLYDKLTIQKTFQTGITLSSNLSHLPTNENNLAYAAAKLFKEAIPVSEGVHIHLEKRIPVAAGMAGGSSDAASVLHGMNELFHADLTLKQLQELGLRLGADVPYCLMGGTALSEGIGELLTSLPPAPACYCVVVKPQVNVSTKYVYEHLSLDGIQHPDIDGMISAIQSGSLLNVTGKLGNALEKVTLAEHPEIGLIKELMKQYGALGTLMSGSGPTVFGLFQNRKTAQKAYYEFKIGQFGKQAFLTEFYHTK